MYKRISWIVYVSIFLQMIINSSIWSSGAEKIWSSGRNSRYATLISTHQPIMLRHIGHKTQLFLHLLFFFLTGKLHYRQWDFWHLTTCCRISVHHYKHQPHHRLIRIFGWMDFYAVLAAALFFIPSLWVRCSMRSVAVIQWSSLAARERHSTTHSLVRFRAVSRLRAENDKL